MIIGHKRINHLVEEFENKINSHAYIFYTNDFDSCLTDVLNLIKKIFDIDDLNKLNSDFIQIKSENQKNILKDDLIFMKNSFLTKSYMNIYRIYLIEEAHKLNPSSSNIILKFLEEPEENIIGFFITTDLDSVLSTIKSRCQIINSFYDNNNILCDNNFELIDSIFMKPVCYNIFEFKKKYFKNIERQELINIFKDYLDKCYDDGLNIKQNCKKIIIINNVISKLINNVNIEYAFDYLFLESSDII